MNYGNFRRISFFMQFCKKFVKSLQTMDDLTLLLLPLVIMLIFNILILLHELFRQFEFQAI